MSALFKLEVLQSNAKTAAMPSAVCHSFLVAHVARTCESCRIAPDQKMIYDMELNVLDKSWSNHLARSTPSGEAINDNDSGLGLFLPLLGTAKTESA